MCAEGNGVDRYFSLNGGAFHRCDFFGLIGDVLRVRHFECFVLDRSEGGNKTMHIDCQYIHGRGGSLIEERKSDSP